jgi:hypothetical protein
MKWIIAAVILCSGCTPDTATVIQAMGQDPANVCVRITTVYGTIEVSRLNAQASASQCGSLVMTRDAPQGTATVGVKVQALPQ